MLHRRKGYSVNRPFYTVDTNVNINAGMIAFLATNGAGITVATTAASGTVPIGTFFNDSASSYIRSTIEQGTFNASDQITLSKGNIRGTGFVKVTSTAGVVYTQGVDYSVTLANGIVTRIGGGAIAASATVNIWYEYTVSASDIIYQGGTNYDRLPNDTLGSGRITVVEGWSHLYTDQYDVTQTYTLNASLYSNASSIWSVAVSLVYPICGRVIQVPTVSDPYLGIAQTIVLA